jgi:L-threonylcarbamoyladenylate synthase
MIPINTIRKNELLSNIDAYSNKLTKGIYIVPVDTIYGLSCNALNNRAVKKLRKVKKSKQPFSVIAPSKDWIINNCVIDKKAKEWLKKLPGPYTLILKLKNKKAVSSSVYNKKDNSIGVRLPNHWFTAVVKKLNFPMVTTSANVSGGNFITSIDDLDPRLKKYVDLIISIGNKKSRPSTLVHLVDEEKIIKR